ncbi:hypothetical protein GCM10017673_15570 [Streptosporangium violaceochromogenes]|nr:hypothetical protein GCM10017673_15570 [Streptosporangium violaceochromogenes]
MPAPPARLSGAREITLLTRVLPPFRGNRNRFRVGGSAARDGGAHREVTDGRRTDDRRGRGFHLTGMGG